jgi:hypothetical protein
LEEKEEEEEEKEEEKGKKNPWQCPPMVRMLNKSSLPFISL